MEDEDVREKFGDITSIDEDVLESCLTKLCMIPRLRAWCNTQLSVLHGNNSYRAVKFYLYTASVRRWINLNEVHVKFCLVYIQLCEEIIKYEFEAYQQETVDVLSFLRGEIRHHESSLRYYVAKLDYEISRYRELEQIFRVFLRENEGVDEEMD